MTMRVHHSTQSFFTAPIKSRQDADSSESSPFLLPDDSDQEQQQARLPSITSGGVPSSISSGFWLSQSGETSSSASDTSVNEADESDATGTSADETETSDDVSDQDILDEFAKWSKMKPADKIRAQYLQRNNLTEESLSQLPADEQKAINDQIVAEIKQKLGTDNANDNSDATNGAAAALSIA
jgi:hypothetical protein